MKDFEKRDQFITEMTQILGYLLQNEYIYYSRASLYGKALNSGIITVGEYAVAKEYYGSLWNYVGD